MRLNRVFRKAASLVTAVCLITGSFSGMALADYANTGDVLENWACQVVVQNGTNDNNANLWMNGGACESITYNTEQHVVLDPADDTFSGVEDVLNFAAIYFSYYGDYTGDAQFDVTLTNVTIYSNGYDAITLADYSSVDSGTNYPSADNDYAVRYDFQDQLDESTRTDVLRNLDRIEFDMVVSAANFSDAPQVEADDAAAADADADAAEDTGDEGELTYTELVTTAGETSNIDVMFFGMDNDWTWAQQSGTTKLNYQVEEHVTVEIDGATVFAESDTPMQVIGFQIGYYDDQIPEDSYYDLQFTITNITLNFDTYDSVVLGDISSEDMDLDSEYGNSGKFYFYSEYFPADADTADMMRHLISIDFDYYVTYVGATGIEAETEEETEEVTEEPEETEEETEAETEKETEEETEAETEKETEAPTTSEEAETESTEASDSSSDSSSGDMVKIIVTIVAVVILLGALVVVAVMYVKKSKQI